MEESTTKHITENPDSIERGTPAKGGAIKVYGNFFINPQAYSKQIIKSTDKQDGNGLEFIKA